MENLEQILTDLVEEIADLKWKLEGQKALIIGLIASGGEDVEQVVLEIRESLAGQNEVVTDHIDSILGSISRPDRKLQ